MKLFQLIGLECIGEKRAMKEYKNMLKSWDAVETDRVKQTRLWLQSLTQISESDADNSQSDFPKVLFLLDNDYGELTTILYLMLGQNCFSNAKVLLTPRLYEHNKTILPGRIEEWRDEKDILKYIDEYKPDVFVIASAYLIPVHNLLKSEALQRVCTFATDKQATVVTTDPFLGLISQWSEKGLENIISIDIPTNASKQLAIVKRLADEKLHKELAAANSVLRSYEHLYPTYTDMEGIDIAPSDSKNRCFFNENLLIPDGLIANSSQDKPHWVFIISEVDFQTQSMDLGPAKFASTVLNLLEQGARLDRNVIFLGPTTLINILHTKMASKNENIHLYNFGAFERVMSLLLTAEYSFYWNVVSHTILIQLWNGKPVILFDKGHLARAIPSMYERIMAWYYQAWEPDYFDHNKPLSLKDLAEFVKRHGETRPQLMKSYQRAPTPETLLNSLMDSDNPS